MYLIVTRNFPPEVGGMQMLMWGLSNSLAKHGNVKVFAESHKDELVHDKNLKFEITRISGIKILRKYRKAYLINDYLKKNKLVKIVIADHWKSLENINFNLVKNKKTICLIHSKEINHEIGTNLNKRMNKSLSKVNHIISNSNFTKDLAINCNVDKNKITVINPGVETYINPSNENIIKAKELFNDAFPKLITVSRFDKRKNHEKVIMNIRNLKEKFPKIKYLCVGHGEGEDNLKKLVNELSLENQVLFIKDISSNFKSALLSESDLFIMPSIIYKKSVEGFGISFIEAAQNGLASIGGKDGGASDAIIHDQTGFICDGNDLSSIYESIINLLDNNKYKKFGENAKEFSKLFVWDLIIKKYLKLMD